MIGAWTCLAIFLSVVGLFVFLICTLPEEPRYDD